MRTTAAAAAAAGVTTGASAMAVNVVRVEGPWPRFSEKDRVVAGVVSEERDKGQDSGGLGGRAGDCGTGRQDVGGRQGGQALSRWQW